VSKALRTERERVLKDLDSICRKLVHVIALQQPTNGFTSRSDFYGGKSELSTARDWLDDDGADLRGDGSTWKMRLCACGTGGGSAVRKVWL
jgi:hypothetical protein